MATPRKAAACNGSTHLTARQQQVLQGIWDGQTRTQLAGSLGITPKAIDFHWYRAKLKFGPGNRMQIMRRALKQGLIKI